jgi:hypothetical protein
MAQSQGFIDIKASAVIQDVLEVPFSPFQRFLAYRRVSITLPINGNTKAPRCNNQRETLASLGFKVGHR